MSKLSAKSWLFLDLIKQITYRRQDIYQIIGSINSLYNSVSHVDHLGVGYKNLKRPVLPNSQTHSENNHYLFS